MLKSIYKVAHMDCAAEENLVRMKLEHMPAVHNTRFDLAEHQVTVYHDADPNDIEQVIGTLELGVQHLTTIEADDAALDEAPAQRTLLWTVLAINAAFFMIEATTGLISGSMALVADSLDMLADALVYALSLAAVGGTLARKQTVARWSGYFQLTLAVLGFVEVLRRVFGRAVLPDFQVMIIVAALALVANAVCLYLLQRSKSQEVHMRASMIFTSNDIVINLGVITAGILVNALGSSLPDLLVGAIVFAIVSRGAFRILKLAN